MTAPGVCHNFEDKQQAAFVVSAAKPRGLWGLIKTLDFALTAGTIGVSLTYTECFPLTEVFGRHIIRQLDREATTSLCLDSK